MRGLANKVCVVTGGSNGIGKAICTRLIEEKCKVIIIDVKSPNWTPQIKYYKCDLSHEEEIISTIQKITKDYNSIDVLVNNAAIFIMKGIDASEEDWKKMNQINIIGLSLITKHLLPLLINCKKGSIINISSISGIIGQGNFAIYNATKFAVRGLTKCWAIDFGKYQIRVNSILPGYIESESSHSYIEERDLDETMINRKLKAQHPIGRIGTPEDVAGVVAFVASEDASFITGADMVVDGGFTIQ